MGDVFDEVYGGGNASIPTTTPTIDVFDEVYGAAPNSETRGVLNQTLRGAGSGLSLVDELIPQISRDPEGSTLSNWLGIKVGAPHLFGLGPEPAGYQSFPEVFDQVGRSAGAITDDVPQTQLGKLAGNVGENAASAALFGPAAMAASGVFGGAGGYVGEAAFGPTGRTVGSLVGNLSPAGISKLGIVKELGEQLGPTVSQFPVFRELFKNAPVEAAVGRALSKSAEDLPAAENALEAAVNVIGPPTALAKLKNTAEIAGDKGLMRAEDAVQNMLPNAPFKSIAEERSALRAADTLEGYNPKTTAYDVSKSLEQAVTDSAENIKAVESATWNALPKDVPVSAKLGDLEDVLKTKIDDITFSGELPIQGAAGALLKRTNELGTEGNVSLGAVQKLRSQALTLQRATNAGLNEADRTANSVAGAIEEHLRNIVDTNVDAGKLPEEAANLWRGARQITKEKINTFGAPKVGTENAGTKGLEQLGLRGQSLDNTQLLREGLNSPDKLAAQINAAKAGGQDIKPLYQQALKSELDGAPQSQWANIIDRKRNQWEQVFTPDEMARLDSNLADVEAELAKNRGSVTSGSATNPRGNVQKVLNSEKGIAGISSGFQSAATLAAAGAGANYGWKKSESVPGGIANALLYGAGGALLGKGLKSATNSASAKYDELLVNALKNPSAALSAIKAAKPSGFGQALADGTTNAAIGGATRGAQSLLNNLLKSTVGEPKQETKEQKPTSLPSLIDKVIKPKGDDMAFKGKPVNEVIEAIKADPVNYTVAIMESGKKKNGEWVLDPEADNPTSTAKGLFQLLDGTAKNLGVKNSLDAGDNFDGFLKLKEETIKKFGSDDVQMIYANHYLGEPTLRRWLDGKPLDEKQAAHVKYFQEKLLPKLNRIYEEVSAKKGLIEV